MSNALYAPLIERELDAIPAAAHAFADAHSDDELWLAIARFAVLAYAPSQHAKRALLACRAAHEIRDETGERWRELLIACAVYVAESRQPWSEPPILEPPHVDNAQPQTLDELRAAMTERDRLRGERWLAARLHDPMLTNELRALARGDALLVVDGVLALLPLLGEKGRYALLRVAVWELVANESDGDDARESLDACIARAVAEHGSIASVQPVLVAIARERAIAPLAPPSRTFAPYPLARDYAQTLLAHAAARRLDAQSADAFLTAVHDNLAHGESYADFSFA
ncbi:MAG: hypothetical protein JO197_02365 [Acidobacteria bacterium]|nr:hypothetical protein [Acidobacteriota bacterium]MBV9476777.1 hypothetical protein [Acidobacteriota bacterium]